MPALDFLARSLLFIWVAFLLGGSLFGRSPTVDRPVLGWAGAAASATLLVLAWYGFLLTPAGSEAGRYAFCAATGAAFTLLGGLHRPGLAPEHTSARARFAVTAAALGHLLYVSAIVQTGAPFQGARLPPLAAALLVGALAAGALLLRSQLRHPLRGPAATACILLICSTTGLAFGMALTAPIFSVLAAGALLLSLGDVILFAEFVLFSPLPASAGSNGRRQGRLPPAVRAAASPLRALGLALVTISIWSALQALA